MGRNALLGVIVILILTLIGTAYISSRGKSSINSSTPTAQNSISPSPTTLPSPSSSSEQPVEGRKCGGIGGLGDCPEGYECVPDPKITEPLGDAPGICVKK